MRGLSLFGKTWPSLFIKKAFEILNNQIKQFKGNLKHFPPMTCILASIYWQLISTKADDGTVPHPQLAIPQCKTLFRINKNTVKKQKKQQIDTPKTKII